MKDSKLTRRDVLRGVLTLTVVGTAGATLVGCGGEEGGGSGGGSDELSCTDTSGLEPAAVQTRNSLAYVDASPHGAAKNCTNCQFYEAAPSAGQCGGCTIVPGPIHPEGYCNSWAAKQA
ncbi:MAG TPA: high-potential iron-sulfur protein [Polyangiaceae bacterium LLY-WYZ-15_(1-7)]|nr:hypothetical protein [Sandaracinus sp.]HJK94606.1 high-potential iron-sulfur protein [Polyangiaceae bacterium LLY-WYZ-15_(1-7)]MBJ69924.1 hypothetical protein [Sandaracinus sp.]HJL02714.1 high-potential iron-sulfur protein [Polyangiaceae bacterium LLY-WYZ-15_(1-7)]HJL10951.1 high-potential iron-sulfur protein [Polyangiaceae bacterium LLY-WYZ-15_(1-7)]